MTAIPATALGEVRLDLNDLLLNGTDQAVGGYAYLWPNLAPGTIYRASNVDPLVAKKVRVTFTGAGLIQDPATGAYPKVLASNAPGASYAGLQWVLGDFHLTGLTPQQQPADRYFEVPVESFVNVGLLSDPAGQPSVQTIYIDTAPILTALNTTDGAVNTLVTTASTTRGSLDARYVQAAGVTTAITAAQAANPGATLTKTTDLLSGVSATASAVIWQASTTLRGITWSTGTNPTRLTATVKGRYAFEALAAIGSTTVGTAWFRVNGTTDRRKWTETQVAGAANVRLIDTITLNVGDYVELMKQSDGTYTLFASTYLNADLIAVR